MKKLLVPTLIIALAFSGCKFIDKWKKGDSADTLAAWQAKQDSMQKAEVLKAKKLEEAKLAKEKAVQDSLRREQELQAKMRFHVIIGSFKVPANADRFQGTVAQMGYSKPTIVQSANGFRMVSVGAFETYGKAFRQIQKFNEGKEEPVEMWVYENR